MREDVFVGVGTYIYIICIECSARNSNKKYMIKIVIRVFAIKIVCVRMRAVYYIEYTKREGKE